MLIRVDDKLVGWSLVDDAATGPLLVFIAGNQRRQCRQRRLGPAATPRCPSQVVAGGASEAVAILLGRSRRACDCEDMSLAMAVSDKPEDPEMGASSGATSSLRLCWVDFRRAIVCVANSAWRGDWRASASAAGPSRSASRASASSSDCMLDEDRMAVAVGSVWLAPCRCRRRVTTGMMAARGRGRVPR